MTTLVQNNFTAAIQSGVSTNWTLTGCTAGHALVLIPHWPDGSGANTFSSFSISGETVEQIDIERGDTDVKARAYVVKSLSSSGDKTAVLTTNNNIDHLVLIAEIDAINSTQGGPSVFSTSPTSGFDITTQANNSIIFALVKGGFNEPSAITGYTAVDCSNIVNRAAIFYNLDVGAAGLKTLTSDYGWWAFAFEIKTSGTTSVKRIMTLGVG